MLQHITIEIEHKKKGILVNFDISHKLLGTNGTYIYIYIYIYINASNNTV